MDDFFLCGWRLRSEVALPSLPRWTPGSDAPVDISFRFGDVVPPVGTDVPVSDPISIDSEGAAFFQIEALGRFCVREGRYITMDLLPGFSAGALQTALMGLGLGTLCYQRGFIPLHASAVAIGGRAVALAGRHGTGKSTLAAKLADRGHLVLSDDIAPFLERREWTVLLPSSRHLRLRGDALRPLGRADAALIKANISGKPKFHVPLEQNSTAAAPPPLAALVNLIRVETDEREEPQPLHGIARVRAVARSIWRRELTNFYPGAARMTANLSLPGVRLFEFRRKRSFDTIEQACDQIEELAATVAA